MAGLQESCEADDVGLSAAGRRTKEQKHIVYDKMASMPKGCILPTLEQRRLVDIGMLIQFHLAAIGHFVVWALVFYELRRPQPDGWEGAVVFEIAFYAVIPISFVVLVVMYVLVRLLFVYVGFGTALATMWWMSVVQAVIMCFTIITPLRLAVPIVLYSIASYHYARMVREFTEP